MRFLIWEMASQPEQTVTNKNVILICTRHSISATYLYGRMLKKILMHELGKMMYNKKWPYSSKEQDHQLSLFKDSTL